MSYDVTPDLPHINVDARFVCPACGHEYHLGVHLKCPSCGNQPHAAEVSSDSADCEARPSRRAASAKSASSEGHRMHLEEVQHVRDTDAHIRSLAGRAMPDPDTVTDRETFVAFAAALAKSRAQRPDVWRSATPEDLLNAAVTWARTSQPRGPLPAAASWRDFARFLLAGATS